MTDNLNPVEQLQALVVLHDKCQLDDYTFGIKVRALIPALERIVAEKDGAIASWLRRFAEIDKERQLAVQAEREACANKLMRTPGGFTISAVDGQLIPDRDGPWMLSRQAAEVVRSRGDSDALKEALSKEHEEGWKSGYHEGLRVLSKDRNGALAKAREEGREQGQREMRDAYETQVSVKDSETRRIVCCPKDGTPIVFEMSDRAKEIENARKQGRLDALNEVEAFIAGQGAEDVQTFVETLICKKEK